MTVWITNVFLYISCESLRELRAVLNEWLHKKAQGRWPVSERDGGPQPPWPQRQRQMWEGETTETPPGNGGRLREDPRMFRLTGLQHTPYGMWEQGALSLQMSSDSATLPHHSQEHLEFTCILSPHFTCTLTSTCSDGPGKVDYVERVSIHYKKLNNSDTEHFEQLCKNIFSKLSFKIWKESHLIFAHWSYNSTPHTSRHRTAQNLSFLPNQNIKYLLCCP